MQIESIRKSTFLPLPPAPSRSTSGKRATTTAKSRTQQHVSTWPHTASSHPDLTPSTLSRAGYYYSPDSPTSTAEEEEEDDQCCCFTCGKKLGGWDTTDDPFVEHWKRSAAAVASGTSTGEIACAWATAVCSAVVHVRKWKEGSSADGGTSGKAKRGKTTQPPANNTQPRPHVYPRSEAHLHPRSELMNRAREQTYFPSAHLVQLQQKEEGREGKAGKGKEGKGWWPHKVKRAWLCTVPNLAKAGFVYTPTGEEDDCVTCFYCNYSVSDWEPVDDPWKQHYDKSPNCPFFTETVEGAPDGNGQGDAVLGSVDASDEEARELPMTVRSKAAAGSKRPTSRNTSATTKARRATAVSVVPPPTVTKSTTRSRIPKTTARSEIEAPALSTTTSRDASDEEKEASDAQPELKVGKTRTKRATTTTVRASAKTTKTASSSTATKGTRRATKAATAESGDDAPKDAPTMAAEDEDTGVDELDALPRSTKSRVKASTRTATSAAKKPVVSRKPVGRAAKTKPVPEAEMIESQTTEVEQSVPSLPVDASDVEMASSRITASETEPSETEKEDSPTDVEEQRREYLAEEEMVKSHRMQMVEVGAREAMAVMQNLGSKRLDTVRALTRDESATPRAVSTKQDPSHSNMDKKLARSSTDDDDDEVIKLTLEEERLTVVEYVRRMYARRREALLGAGEAKIADWEEKAGQARAFIESIPTRN